MRTRRVLVWMTLTHLPTIHQRLRHQPFGFGGARVLSPFCIVYRPITPGDRAARLSAMVRHCGCAPVRFYMYHAMLLVLPFSSLFFGAIAAVGKRPPVV